jgi:hypothetical protein
MTRPSIPRDVAIRRAGELRGRILKELERGPRLTRELAAMFGIERTEAHRSLIALREAGKVSSTNDRRMSVCGVVAGSTWQLANAPAADNTGLPRRKVARGPWPRPPRDPLLWALYGGQPC